MIHPYALFRILIVHPSTSRGQGNVLAPADRSNITFSVQVSYLPPVTVVHEPCGHRYRRGKMSAAFLMGRAVKVPLFPLSRLCRDPGGRSAERR